VRIRHVMTLIAAVSFATLPTIDAFAKSGGGGGGSRSGGSSFGSGGGGSSWGRSSSPSFSAPKPSAPTTSGGYARPAAPSPAPAAAPAPVAAPKPSAPAPATSGGYARPTAPQAAPITSGGYARPAAIGTGAAVGVAVGVGAAHASDSGKTSTSSSDTAKPATSGGYQRPATSSEPAKAVSLPAAPTTRTGLDRAVAAKQSSEALSALRQEQTKFKAPPVATESIRSNSIASGYRSQPQTTHITVNRYYENRDNYYRSSGWSPPSYYTSYSPSYGAYDTQFLLWAMAHNPSFYHHHYDDPGIRAFRRDQERLAEERAELKADIARLDERLKAEQGPRNSSYLPEGIKPEVALAAEVVTGFKVSKLSFATGVDGGTMHAMCAGNADGLSGFKKIASALEVECVQTGGSRDNVLGFVAGKYEAIVAQADAIDWAMRASKSKGFGKYQLPAYDESLFLLVGKNSEIRKISDLKPRVHTLYVGPQGSGGQLTYENLAHHARQTSWMFFSSENDQYKGVNIKNAAYMDAIKTAAADPKAAVMVMTATNSAFMKKIEQEFGDQVRLVPFSGEWSFAKVKDRDGNVVYKRCTVPGASYPKLLSGASSIKTLCVQEVLVVSETWVKNNRTAEDIVLTAWEFTKPELQRINQGMETE
jgi:TRAP-type uncharacterized transport system substrate-binding protein